MRQKGNGGLFDLVGYLQILGAKQGQIGGLDLSISFCTLLRSDRFSFLVIFSSFSPFSSSLFLFKEEDQCGGISSDSIYESGRCYFCSCFCCCCCSCCYCCCGWFLLSLFLCLFLLQQFLVWMLLFSWPLLGLLWDILLGVGWGWWWCACRLPPLPCHLLSDAEAVGTCQIFHRFCCCCCWLRLWRPDFTVTCCSVRMLGISEKFLGAMPALLIIAEIVLYLSVSGKKKKKKVSKLSLVISMRTLCTVPFVIFSLETKCQYISSQLPGLFLCKMFHIAFDLLVSIFGPFSRLFSAYSIVFLLIPIEFYIGGQQENRFRIFVKCIRNSEKFISFYIIRIFYLKFRLVISIVFWVVFSPGHYLGDAVCSTCTGGVSGNYAMVTGHHHSQIIKKFARKSLSTRI